MDEPTVVKSFLDVLAKLSLPAETRADVVRGLRAVAAAAAAAGSEAAGTLCLSSQYVQLQTECAFDSEDGVRAMVADLLEKAGPALPPVPLQPAAAAASAAAGGQGHLPALQPLPALAASSASRLNDMTRALGLLMHGLKVDAGARSSALSGLRAVHTRSESRALGYYAQLSWEVAATDVFGVLLVLGELAARAGGGGGGVRASSMDRTGMTGGGGAGGGGGGGFTVKAEPSATSHASW